MMSQNSTSQRALSIRFAASDPKQAVAVARAIEDPWFRCQSLAYAARYWPGNDYQSLLEEAIEAAEVQDNWYKRVTVSAWPIRAYLERNCPVPAKKVLQRFAAEVSNIENRGGRSEAILMLFQAAKPFDRTLWEPVLRLLVQATEPAISWRQIRNIRSALAMLSAEELDLVQAAIRNLSDEKIVARLQRDVEIGKAAEPRPFFWLH